VPTPRELYARIPDPWRRVVGARRVRRWLRAVRFAQRHNAALPADAPGVSFFPMRVEETAALAHVLRRIGARIVAFGDPAALTVAWHTGTWISAADAARLPADALNAGCLDISKTTVDRLWADAAGYSIAVDALTYRGRMVVKPDANGVRGGQIVDGPIGISSAGMVYERLVDCRSGDRIHTTRPIVLRGRILAVYEKWRAHPDWFAGREQVKVSTPGDCYSDEEIATLLRFCDLIALEYGELDVVRDRESGLIYVVDANRTPVRPKGLAPADEDAAFRALDAEIAGLVDRGPVSGGGTTG
jgi:hypothetical protein